MQIHAPVLGSTLRESPPRRRTRACEALACTLLLVFATSSFAATAAETSSLPDVGVHAERAAPVDEALREHISSAATAIQHDDFDAADGHLRAALASPAFDALEDKFRVATWMMCAGVSVRRGDTERSLDCLERVLHGPAPDPDMLGATFELAVVHGRRATALDAMTMMRSRDPKRIRELDERVVFEFARVLRQDPAERRRRIAYLDALFDGKWTTSDGQEPSSTWLDLAQLHLDDGRIERARVVVARIDSPEEVARLVIDRRFDALTRNAPAGRYDVTATLERQLVRLREARARQPRKAINAVSLAYALITAARFEEALAVCDDALKRATRPDGSDAYDDAADSVVWLHDYRARALLRLGRVDDAVAVWEQARQRQEGQGKNVSQAINLAAVYATLGRREPALAALADLGEMSAFGRMQEQLARLTAEADSPDSAEVAAALAYLKEHRRDSESAYTGALIRVGRLDDAAVELIERLDDAEHRGDALLDVQRYRVPTVSASEAVWQARYDSVVARPDVQAAIQRTGRVMELPLYRLPW